MKLLDQIHRRPHEGAIKYQSATYSGGSRRRAIVTINCAVAAAVTMKRGISAKSGILRGLEPVILAQRQARRAGQGGREFLPLGMG